MSALEWGQLSEEFVWEGSLRDVFVVDTSVLDWKLAFSALHRDGFAIRGTVDWSGVSTAEVYEPFSANQGRMVEFEVNGVRLICHFLDEREIEFDLDPRQVAGQAQLDGLVAFMRSLATAVDKSVLLSPENMHDHPFVRVAPDGGCDYISSEGFFIGMAHGGRSE